MGAAFEGKFWGLLEWIKRELNVDYFPFYLRWLQVGPQPNLSHYRRMLRVEDQKIYTLKKDTIHTVEKGIASPVLRWSAVELPEDAEINNLVLDERNKALKKIWNGQDALRQANYGRPYVDAKPHAWQHYSFPKEYLLEFGAPGGQLGGGNNSGWWTRWSSDGGCGGCMEFLRPGPWAKL